MIDDAELRGLSIENGGRSTEFGGRSSDAELLRRYAGEKSEPAFAALVQRHLDLVYSAALRRLGGDAHGAADVAQRVFVALACRADSLSRHTRLPAWLYTTTRNLAIDHARAEQRRRAHEREASLMPDLTSNPSASAEWETLRPMLDGAMDDLGESDREAVVLRFFARQPFAEIGASLRVSEDAARMRVDRALEKLRIRLGRRGVTSTAAALALVLANEATAAAPIGLASSVTGAALASAAVVGPAVGFISFMSTSKMAVAAAALVLAFGFGAAGYENYANRKAGETRRAAERENAALAARVDEQRRRAEAAVQTAAEMQQALDAGKAEQQRVARAASLARQQAALAESEAFMARHPEVRQAAIDNWRADMGGRFAPLLKALQLSPAQIERFKDLAAQGIVGIMTGPNGAPLRYSIGSLDRQPAEAELRTLLGEAGFKQYKEWNDHGGAGLQVTTELAGSLYRTDTPLTAAQSTALQRIFTESKVAIGGSSSRRFDWDAIMAEARDVLSEPQLAELDHLQAQDRFDQAFSQSRRQASSPSATPVR